MQKTHPSTYKVAAVQISLTRNADDNVKKAAMWIRKAADQGAQVICLPELYRTPYFCQVEESALFDLAETIPGPSTEALSIIAKERQVALVIPIFEKRAPGLYHNSIAMIDADGQLVGVYRKMHIPDDPSFYEKFYFTPGDLGFKAFDTRYGKIGTLICWDQWYPEGARITALMGASILMYPTAIGWHPSEKEKYGKAQYDSWMTIQRSHAIANGVYVAAINRVGHEIQVESSEGLEFWGSSFICDPQGVIMAQGSHDGEEILYADIDLEHLENIRRNWPFLRDRRIDAYQGIDRRYLV